MVKSKFKIVSEFTCEFCSGGIVYVGFCESNPGVFDEPAVIHTKPMCDKFEATDPLDFVIENRRAKGLPASPEDTN